MPFPRSLAIATLIALAAPVAAQPTLAPSADAPYRQKLDLTVPDATFLLLPEPQLARSPGPHRLRFAHAALDSLLGAPGTVHYVTFRDGAFQLQVLNLRPAPLPTDALGAQPYEIVNARGEVAARGSLLVVARAPEAVGAVGLDGGRVLEVGRATPVRLEMHAYGNFAGEAALVNAADYTWTPLADSASTDSAAAPDARPAGAPDTRADARTDAAVGTVIDAVRDAARGEATGAPDTPALVGELTALRREAPPPRFAVRTRDGRAVELAFPGLTVRARAPRPIAVAGGPLFVDAVGAGSAEVTIGGLPAGGPPPEVSTPSAELTVREQRWDRSARRLTLSLDFAARAPRAAGTREAHDLLVRSGAAEYRGRVEVVTAPTVSLAATDQGDGTRAVVTLGTGPAVVRVVGQNLDEVRLDCTPLGPGAKCRTLGGGATELLTEVTAGAGAREGEHLLPLVATGRRPRTVMPNGVRLQVERPAVPVALSDDRLLTLACGAAACRPGKDVGALVTHAGDARSLALVVNDSLIPAASGWQRLVITVTRVRGDQRQVVRTLGSLGAPRAFRRGLPSAAVPLVDAATDVRHGDALVVRVEHALEQYPAASRIVSAAAEPFVRTVYVDGGALTRLAADVSVQPVLYSFSGSLKESAIEPLYMNAGIGVTWQPMNWRMQPRLASAKLQLIGMSLVDDAGEKLARQPALFLSANLRVPGTDAGRPVVLTSGVARLLSGETGWRLLAGAGVDLGLARLVSGR